MPSIFLGGTTSPAREFIAKCIKERNPTHVLMPCAGRFAAVEALVGAGIPKSKIVASDIGLFSSIIGYLADPRHTLSELGITILGDLPEQPVSGRGADYDLGAQAMLALGLGQISNKHQKGLNERAEVLRNWQRYHLET